MNLRLKIAATCFILSQNTPSYAIELNDTLGSWARATMDQRSDLAARTSVAARTLKPNATPDKLLECINVVAMNSADWDQRILETASLCAIMAQ